MQIWQDPLVEEIHQIREQLATKHGNDIATIGLAKLQATKSKSASLHADLMGLMPLLLRKQAHRVRCKLEKQNSRESFNYDFDSRSRRLVGLKTLK